MSLLQTLLAVLTTLGSLIVALPLITLVASCMALVFLTRVIRRIIEPRYSPWSELLEFDPTFGWKPKAFLHTHYLADDVFYATTDAQGWRGNTSLSDSDIVVFGDSFAWGYGVDDRNHFASVAIPLRIKAIGTMGYNMVQAFQWMEHLSSYLHGKSVVWFIYYGNDLYENLVPHMRHYRMPFMRKTNGTRGWEIVTSHLSPQAWSFTSEHRDIGEKYYEKLAELCSETFLSQRAYAACAFLIGQAKVLCEEVGAQLSVVGIPDIVQFSAQGVTRLQALVPESQCVDPNYPDKQIRQICDGLDVPFVSLKDHLNICDHKKYDVHWNEKGHRKVAGVLMQMYYDYIP